MNYQSLIIKYVALFQWLLIAIPFCGLAQSKNESTIEGKLRLDSIWKPVVYLSHIPTFKDMYTMSKKMIIAETKIDSSGNFKFITDVFPKTDNLYRLHISKKEAPPASLIIGGKEENHIFLIANGESSISIENAKSNGIFESYTINGYQPNRDFKYISALLKENEHGSSSSLSLKREFMEKNLQEQLRKIADTSSHAIVSLYALNNSKFEATFLENQKFYLNYLEKWKNDDSSYFKELRAKLPKEKRSSILTYIALGIFFFLLGFSLNYFFISKRKKSNNSLKTLSIQERKIFQLIQSGKSNKEISDEYNIGISTVKSHVSNIYSKLNIKSRKEAIDIK